MAELAAALANGSVGKALRRDDIGEMIGEIARLRRIEAAGIALRNAWDAVPLDGQAVAPALMDRLRRAKLEFLVALPETTGGGS